MLSSRLLPSVLVLLAASADARAQISVPGDFATIQAAIDAASDTDTIDVAPGTYAEVIAFKGKTITVRGSGGPEVTTIDGTGLANSVVRINAGCDAGTRLEGFTIRGGSALAGNALAGGGIRVSNSTVTVAHCIITRNTAQNGGGVAVRSGSNATFEDCTISDNVALGLDFSGGSGGGGGGGAHIVSATVFKRCDIIDNRSPSENNGGAGGLYLGFSPDATILEDCTIARNSTPTAVGGLFVGSEVPVTVTRCTFSGNSGGLVGAVLLFVSGVVTFDSCRFEHNRTDGFDPGAILAMGAAPDGMQLQVMGCDFNGEGVPPGYSGGAVLIDDAVSLLLEDSRFVANRAYAGGAVAMLAGGGTHTAEITRCSFEWNSAVEGGAILLDVEDVGSAGFLTATVTDCTFTNNSADTGGGLLVRPTVDLTLAGNTFCGNSGGHASGAFVDNGNNTFSDDCADWTNLGSGLPGSDRFGTVYAPPALAAFGEVAADEQAELHLAYAPPAAQAALFVGLSGNPTPFKGGHLLPVPVLVTMPCVIAHDGQLELKFRWPPGLPPGFELVFQYAIANDLAPQGVSLSNAVRSMAH